MNDFIVNLAFIYMSVLRSAMCFPFTVPLPCFVRALTRTQFDYDNDFDDDNDDNDDHGKKS